MEIVTQFKKNLSIRAIADIVSCSKSVVGRIMKEYKKSGCVSSAKTRGRHRKTSERQNRVIQRTGLKDRFVSAGSISRDMKAENNMDVSRFTISRRLNERGLYARRPQKKPLMSAKNKVARLKFAQEHVNKPHEWWCRVFFSYESKFNLFGSDRKN